MLEEKKEGAFAAESPAIWKTITASRTGQFPCRSRGICTFTTVHPLSLGWTSSTGSSEPFGPSAELILARDYFWKIMNFFPTAPFDTRLGPLSIMFFRKFFVFWGNASISATRDKKANRAGVGTCKKGGGKRQQVEKRVSGQHEPRNTDPP